MKTFLPFPNPGVVIHLRKMEQNFLVESKINEEELRFLASKQLAKVMVFSYIENNALLCPVFRELGFDTVSLELPSFPNRLNFSDDESYKEYGDYLSIFINELVNRDILIYFPLEKYTEIVLFLISSYLLKDESVTLNELVTYFFDENKDLEAIYMELDEMRNFLSKEYYIKYLMKKNSSTGTLRNQMLVAKEKLVQRTISSAKVELFSTESSMPYELNLSSLGEKISHTDTPPKEFEFNISSLTPKEFKPEMEEPKELLENLMEMADTFDPNQFEEGDEVLSLDEIREEEIEKKPAFITVSQITKASPKVEAPKPSDDWDTSLSFDLPDPEIPMDSFLEEFKEPFFKKSPVKTKPIKKNFLGLPEDW